MQESDGIIIASPSILQCHRQTKAWLDRLFPYIGIKPDTENARGKKASFIFTQNQPDTRLFETPVATFMHMVGLTGLSVRDYMLACDLDAGSNLR